MNTTAMLPDAGVNELAVSLRRGVGVLAEQHPENVLPHQSASAAVTFLAGEGKLIATPEFRSYVTVVADGAVVIDFEGLAAWADATDAKGFQRGATPGWSRVPAARMACLLAGHTPWHPAGSEERENWSPACIAYDMGERNGDLSDDAAVIAAWAEIVLGRRRYAC